MLWGSPAQAKAPMLTNSRHLILRAPHPSPLSAYNGFFGSRPFSKTNDFLIANGLTPIDWADANRE
jgi:uracil-DNA glycosylase